ncbi:nose resistant to fluoxetine protein 6 [Trichonephila clavipes]|nr:nose resistant to fluoxetine protein 6 [Trichonephila clavipes]
MRLVSTSIDDCACLSRKAAILGPFPLKAQKSFMYKMNFCSRFSCPDYPWQATFTKISTTLKYKVLALANSSLPLHSQGPRKFTNGAIFMILVILLFLLFAAIGTAITIFEYFDKPHKRRNSVERFKICKDYLNCFCIATNGKKILNIKSPEGDFGCLHGLRFISNVWVIAIHVFLITTFAAVDLEEMRSWASHWSAPIFLNVSYSVNVFFVISGFLNGYFFSLEYSKKNGRISWLNFYRKRFLRITPFHMMVYWTYTILFTYTGSGPLWPTYDTNPVCRKYWWWDLLYINNYLGVWQQVTD